MRKVRAGQRSRLVEIDDDLLPNLSSVAPSQEHCLVLKELFRAIDGLNADQREVLLLVVGQDLSYEETAQICGCPIGTVRSRLARARRELERMLSGEVAMPIPDDGAARTLRRGHPRESQPRHSLEADHLAGLRAAS